MAAAEEEEGEAARREGGGRGVGGGRGRRRRGAEDGGRAQRPATVQHPEEGDRGEGRRSDLRGVLLAQEREDQLCSLGDWKGRTT